MESILIEYPNDWKDYELLDCGDGAKLERFGSYRIVRPDPRVLWKKSLPEDDWKNADARYVRSSSSEGHWTIRTHPPTPWQIFYKNLVFSLRPTEFKHIGVFPEQAVNWTWLTQTIAGRPINVLNLFAYTGGATIACALAGAKVTHVDSVKSVITWAHENAQLSHVPEQNIRWIEDDVYKFVTREAKRGKIYDAVILDPPRFGRGTKGEVWKIDEDLARLLSACKKILSKNPVFFLVNAYTADLSSLVLLHLMQDMFGSVGNSAHGQLAIPEKSQGRLLPSGIFARWNA